MLKPNEKSDVTIHNKVSELKTSKVLVVGDVMLDRYLIGEVSRISPEAPVPIMSKTGEYNTPGGAANVAMNLVAANQTVTVASVTGRDETAVQLKALMHEKGINTDYVQADSMRKTTLKTRFIGQNNQQVFRFDIEDDEQLTDKAENMFLGMLLSKLPEYSLIVLSDYMKGLLTSKVTSAVIETANDLNIKVVVDVKDKLFNKYCGAFLLKPNLHELRMLTNLTIKTDKEIEDAANFLRRECKCPYVLVTKGSNGMTLVSENGASHYDCISREVFDVTGAGDTVIAYVAAGIASGLTVEESVEIANFAAGIKVQKSGTAAVFLDEVTQYVIKYSNEKPKIINADNIDTVVKNSGRKKIVFTNGCFDILHSGHISYLRQAAVLGDMLIIGVNSDASVRRLKGEGRPIVNEEDRMALLASLEFVDYVIMFDEDTPLELIRRINPHILVKGGDYAPDEVVGKKEVEGHGGEVMIIPLTGGKSTTGLISKIVAAHKRSNWRGSKND